MSEEKTFWEHLEELRGVVLRSLAVFFVLFFVAIFLKTWVFDIVLGPCREDFALYRWFNLALGRLGLEPLAPFNLSLVNIELASPFFTHMKVSALVALIVAVPIIVWLLWGFVRPALTDREIRAVRGAFGFAAVLFYAGLAVGYFFIFPLTIRFLGTYEVSELVPNQISLKSYISMFMGLIFVMGVVFELPTLIKILNSIGLVKKSFLKKYRRHAFMALMILSAIITPSGDIFTLMVVTCPLYLLYELSIAICKDKE